MIGDAASLARALDEPIRVQTDAVDFERIIAERRRLRTQRKAESERQ
jgi:hypothetical protein